METNKKKVTIITICKNAENLIGQTVESVLNQSYENIEYIIIDGKSTDKTSEIINKYGEKISKLVSERDNGIYDAMNKGVRFANGEIICFMNAGDKFHSKNVVEKAVGCFENNDVGGIFGDIYLIDSKGSAVAIKKQKFIGDSFLMNDSICHQSMFVKTELFKKCGLFDLKYNLGADFEWFLRVTKRFKVNFKYADIVVADYILGGFSSDKIRYEREHQEIIFLYYSFTRVMYLRLVSKFNRFSKFYHKI
jgi:glycosyltransferase involved in cell wall biosynthesis